MNGFLIINKQEGWTSHDVVAKARGILGTKKVGHLGTLDPLATGVLVLAVGKALKLVEFLMGCEKTYEAEIELGKVSDTYDYEGKVERQNVKGKMQIAKSELKKALESFEGEIEQMPPVYSALKIKGKKACDLARAGKKVELKPRRVKINEIKILNFEWPFLKLRIDCSTGTYIRSLAHDLGQKLGCGGCLKALNRLRVGNFKLEEALLINQINEEKLLLLERGVEGMNKLLIDSLEAGRLRRGQRLKMQSSFVHLRQTSADKKSKCKSQKLDSNNFVAVFENESFIGVGEIEKDVLKPKKILF
ncbi:MAG TPA: tRNA pseudouridine(55) synthase TruB [Candidatus Peregrinibacteria bacterium]|nr:tRNA pseudouridine(55) synthase TruB [Candidatus Peregrinibacteria bacterium]